MILVGELKETSSGIYLITNIVNGKVYVGSSNNLRKRMREHKSQLNNNNHHSIHLQRAWDKYGKENFIFSVIELVLDENKLFEREQYWMEYYNVCDLNFGYNILPNAGSPRGRKFPDEFRKTEWFLNRIKAVLQFDLDGVFIREWPSATEISRSFNVKPTIIFGALKRKNKFNKSYYLIYKDEFTDGLLNEILTKKKKSRKGISIPANNKKVNQYDKDGVFIKTWDSITIASESLNISNRNICGCCKNKRKTAGGFIWSYDN